MSCHVTGKRKARDQNLHASATANSGSGTAVTGSVASLRARVIHANKKQSKSEEKDAETM